MISTELESSPKAVSGCAGQRVRGWNLVLGVFFLPGVDICLLRLDARGIFNSAGFLLSLPVRPRIPERVATVQAVPSRECPCFWPCLSPGQEQWLGSLAVQIRTEP